MIPEEKRTLILKIFTAVFVIFSLSLLIYRYVKRDKGPVFVSNGDCNISILPVKYLKISFNKDSDYNRFEVEILDENNGLQVKILKKNVTESVFSLDRDKSKLLFNRLNSYFCSIRKAKNDGKDYNEKFYDMHINREDDSDFQINDVGVLMINGEMYDDTRVDRYFHPDLIFSEFLR